MTLLSTLAALGMAFGAPLVYADQAWSIQKRRNAEGFSKDVCAVLLIANLCRIFFWFGERFELALLLQSILMIVAMLYLLSLLLKFRPGSFASSAYSVGSGDRSGYGQANSGGVTPTSSTLPTTAPTSNSSSSNEQSKPSNPLMGLFDAPSNGQYAPLFGLHLPVAPTLEDDEEEQDDLSNRPSPQGRVQQVGRKAKRFLSAGFRLSEGETRRDGSSGGRIFGFWTWPNLSSYLIFLLGLVGVLTVFQLTLGGLRSYIWLLGMFALGLEATLPVPQALQNHQRRSLGGFRLSVLAGWTFGDCFKTVYFLQQGSPIQFVISALFALSVDAVILWQLYAYREQTAKDWEELRMAEAEAMEVDTHRQRSDRGQQDNGHAGSRQSQPPPPRSSSARVTKPAPARVDESTMFQIEADDDEDDEEGDLSRAKR